MRVDIKPLSVNAAWQGRRFKTDRYKNYTIALSSLLKPLNVPDGKLAINVTFGFSSASCDIDNGLKPFIDILQIKYGFNDSRIYRLEVNKVVVKKGKEFIDFEIWELLD